jgi:transcription elongation GreA/GreB family factor
MNKAALIRKIVAELTAQLERYAGAASTARAEAIDEENQAEDKYDTRGLEASYLAAGQSRQMAETAEALQKFGALTPTRLHDGDPIDVGALVELKTRREQTLYFMGPSAGGTEVVHGKKTVLVLTPQSPLGAQLMGRKQGERLKMKVGGLMDDYTITSVS